MSIHPANNRQIGGEHYRGDQTQHWDWVLKNRLGYFEGNFSKYIWRANRKGETLDNLLKAEHYLDKIEESRNWPPRGGMSLPPDLSPLQLRLLGEIAGGALTNSQGIITIRLLLKLLIDEEGGPTESYTNQDR